MDIIAPARTYIATAKAVRTHNESRDVPPERLYNNSFVLIDVSTAIVASVLRVRVPRCGWNHQTFPHSTSHTTDLQASKLYGTPVLDGK